MSAPRRVTLSTACAWCALTPQQLWLAYLSLGGSGSCAHVCDVMDGTVVAAPFEHDVLAHALNEHFADRDELVRVPYTAALHE